MNMTEKNGQPSMEEILASIRRIIAEEPASHAHNGELRGTPIMLKGDSALDDASEFDLPAIFRSSPPQAAERQTPLLGRLTDAIRSATTSQPETRSSAASEEHQAVETVEVAAVGDVYSGGLSSLKPVRPEGPAEPLRPFNGTPLGHEPQPLSAPSAGSGAFPITASGSKSEDEPKRVMAPFKDTHFMRMSSSGTAPSPAPSPAPAPFPAAVPPPEAATPPPNFGTIIPGQFDRASLATPQVPHVAPVAMPPPPLPTAEPVQHALVSAPPSGAEPGGIEDATADLLRPMLRQWLADNMPRMVEKALHIEIAESLKGPKKP
jgi:hypothetical protein